MDSRLSGLLEALGNPEEPFGMFYTDTAPAEGFTPKEGADFSYEMERKGDLDTGALFSNWSCVIGQIWLARKKKTAAYFDSRHFGCVGGSFYLGFHKPQLDFIAYYVSTGVPGKMHGERYLSSPEVTRRFFNEVDPRPAPAKYCVFKPVSRFAPGEVPETVTFFARAEVIGGLSFLASFVTDDFEAVASPFGAGCSYLVTWPLLYLARGKMKAVVGGWDPSDRKFLKTDEITFTAPWTMYDLFLQRWPESFLTTETWTGVKKKIAKSREVWGE